MLNWIVEYSHVDGRLETYQYKVRSKSLAGALLAFQRVCKKTGLKAYHVISVTENN